MSSTKCCCSCSCSGGSSLPKPGVWYPDEPTSSSSCCPITPDCPSCPSCPSRPDCPSDPVCPPVSCGGVPGFMISDIKDMVFNGQHAVRAVLNGVEVWHYFTPELEVRPSFVLLEADGDAVPVQVRSNTVWRVYEA